MARFVDVEPGSRHYDDITEATNTLLQDGEPLLKGITFQVFDSKRPYIYQEVKATKNQTKFSLYKSISPTSDNPLYCFIDGVSTPIKDVKQSSGKTYVYLHAGAKQGSLISFVANGVPAMNYRHLPYTKTRPSYPHFALKYRDYYIQERRFEEYVYVFGRKLKKAHLDKADLNPKGNEANFDQGLAAKYIGEKQDTYIITPSGRIHLPWHLEGVSGKVNYVYKKSGSYHRHREDFKAFTGNEYDTKAEPYFTNRFFPEIHTLRKDMIIALNRLRRHLYATYTDIDPPTGKIDLKYNAYEGQTNFRINATFPKGSGKLLVYSSLKPYASDGKWHRMTINKEYIEVDSSTIELKVPAKAGYMYHFYYDKRYSDLVYDIGRSVRYWDNENRKFLRVNGISSDWAEHADELDSERFYNGDRLLQHKIISNWYDKGNTIPRVSKDYWYPINNIERHGYFVMPETPISKIEAVIMINKFIKWSLERFL